MPIASHATSDIPFECKVAFLRQPANYPEPVKEIESVETHMSWVFLTGRHAYKLKKPVRHDFLDFTTIEARKFYCDEEIRLNRRLAPRIYLGKIPLIADHAGHLYLGNCRGGTIIDWLVEMRRLPSRLMLEQRIKTGRARDQDASRIISTLTNFYLACPRITLTMEEYSKKISTELQHNLHILGDAAYGLPAKTVHRIYDAQVSALHALRSCVKDRLFNGRIVEGHGDLRPEHIFVGRDISIIDCLEFSRLLRIADMVDEVSFLALECERLGAQRFAELLLENYRILMKDDPPSEIIHFYQSCRATTRARLAIRHLDEERFRLTSKWIDRTNEYLNLALTHIDRTGTMLNSS